MRDQAPELPPPATVPSLAQAVQATGQRMQAQAAQVGWSLTLDAQTYRYVLASEEGTAQLHTWAEGC